MKFINGMANISIKSAKLTPFGGIFSIMEQSDSKLSSVIDSTLGIRSSTFGYQYSEIIRSLMSVYFCGGACIEDVTTHLMKHLSLHPTLRTCSADTILRAIRELTVENISYTSSSGRFYDFNTAATLNSLLIYSGQKEQDLRLDEISSERRNPILADVMAQLDYMEKRGRGLKRIYNETKALDGYSDKPKTVIRKNK